MAISEFLSIESASRYGAIVGINWVVSSDMVEGFRLLHGGFM